MNLDDQKKYEDEVQKVLDNMAQGHKLIIYKTLYHEGLRIGDIQDKMQKIKQHIPYKVETTTPDFSTLYGMVLNGTD